MPKGPAQIVTDFCANGFRHVHDIPGNRMFYTDTSASTLVLAEENVVIESYYLFPNIFVPLHSHPFDNQMIFISGDLTARRQMTPLILKQKIFKDEDGFVPGTILPSGLMHGFDTGPRGAIIYNIQIWPEDVENPLSAAIAYIGPSMGPIHDQIKQRP